MGITKPIPGNKNLVSQEDKVVGRYGSRETAEILGEKPTYVYSLRAQAYAVKALSELYPEIVSSEIADEFLEKANLNYVDVNRIREIEDKKHHDVIAINESLEEVLSEEAKPFVNLARTSADTTETAKALQLKDAVKNYTRVMENLRDIVIEKAMEWRDIPSMGTTHSYFAVPESTGRPFAHYAETIQSGLDMLKYVYENSIKGKWGDATGNHHSAKTLGIDGIKLQEKYMELLGLDCTDAPAQIPAREYIADIVYVVARITETLGNLSDYVKEGKSDYKNVFRNMDPKKRKGSSAMPHKDIKGGNPITEEQVKSLKHLTRGFLTTSVSSCETNYARDLDGSMSDRVILDHIFKLSDNTVRSFAKVIFYLGLDKEKNKEILHSTYGVTTSEQVMTYLINKKHLPRSEVHDLIGELSTRAYNEKVHFSEVLKRNEIVSAALTHKEIDKLTDVTTYIGESKKIIDLVKDKCYQKITVN